MADRSTLSLKLPIEQRDHIQGSPSAVVTLVEYGDYQCPFCGDTHPVIKRLQEQFGDSLRFVFRSFPLTRVHAYAQGAAEAAEAAGAQGKFWEMHDYLFEHQATLDTGHLMRAAVALGLDKARFAQEVAEGVYAGRVREDVESGIACGVVSTPTMFVNGVRNGGDDDFETLGAMIEEAIRLSQSSTDERLS